MLLPPAQLWVEIRLLINEANVSAKLWNVNSLARLTYHQTTTNVWQNAKHADTQKVSVGGKISKAWLEMDQNFKKMMKLFFF